jgi:hypothetical protein
VPDSDPIRDVERFDAYRAALRAVVKGGRRERRQLRQRRRGILRVRGT